MSTIDLRSDTVTSPTDAMRAAMASAPVGDDVYGDDPTVAELERRMAELLGKEASLFVPSGTMANQIALLTHCRPGDEVVIGKNAHCYLYESGAGAALAGVQFVEVGEGGTFDAEQMERGIKGTAFYNPRPRLVCLENTHNRGGGRVFSQDALESVCRRAKEMDLLTHLDGARLWNASAATGLSLATLAAPVDTVCVAFSKGLGAPMGSVLAGSAATMNAALRYRRMMGGALRQAGIVCAGALHALDHHVDRIKEDHANAQRLAVGLNALPGIRCDAESVETNIVNFEVPPGTASEFCERAAKLGVLLGALDQSNVRAVTHLNVGESSIHEAIERLGKG